MTSLIAVIISGIIGFNIGNKKQNSKFNLKTKAIRSSQNGLINPLTDYEISSSAYSQELRLFREVIQKEVDFQTQSGNVNKIAVYFRSLNDGPWFGINEDQNFFPASLLKVPIMMAYYKQTEENPDILKKEIKYDEEYRQKFGDNNEGEYFKPEKSIEFGKTYTTEELIRYMVVYSDNNAKNLLISNLPDINNLFRVYRDLGITSPPELRSSSGGSDDIFSVHEYSTMFRVLYNASYLTKDFSKKALGLLVEAQFPNGLSAGIPKDVKLADKFGEYIDPNKDIKQLHDCGIVYYPKKPYIACIMTRGTDFDKMEKAIAAISKSIYIEVDNQLQNKK